MSIYSEWEFIASIPKDVKPCFRDKTFISVNEWFGTIKRRYKGEKGENGIIYLEDLIEKTKKNNIDKNLRELLQKSILGINNLVYTYKKDGQKEVSENYNKCIDKIDKIIKSNNFFGYTPKLVK